MQALITDRHLILREEPRLQMPMLTLMPMPLITTDKAMVSIWAEDETNHLSLN